MLVKNQRVLLTGASGGIGQALARILASRGARLGIVGRRIGPLQKLAEELTDTGAQIEVIVANLLDNTQRKQAIQVMQDRFGGIDILINNAGIMEYKEFVDQDVFMIEQILAVNVTAPMQLTHDILPDMLNNRQGQIVNIGSTFGSIAFACFASYSASKFAMRGFSEALRRELEGSGVNVSYIAPRAVKTPLNSPAVYRMADKVKMNMDEPSIVAQSIVRAIEKDKKDVYLGFPESLFVRINALLPRLVDGSLRKQNKIMRECTREV